MNEPSIPICCLCQESTEQILSRWDCEIHCLLGLFETGNLVMASYVEVLTFVMGHDSRALLHIRVVCTISRNYFRQTSLSPALQIISDQNHPENLRICRTLRNKNKILSHPMVFPNHPHSIGILSTGMLKSEHLLPNLLRLEAHKPVLLSLLPLHLPKVQHLKSRLRRRSCYDDLRLGHIHPGSL